MTAYYILTRKDPASVDPQWVSHVGHLIDWVRHRFGRGPFFGAWAIDEQGTPDGRGCCSRAGQGSHGGRWAAINALYAEKTGDGQAREDAFRSMNYATYFARSDGRVACCGEDYHEPYWFSDGYADYLRHFNWIMGALPDLAPVGQNHLLRSSSIVQKVTYSPGRISYKTLTHDHPVHLVPRRPLGMQVPALLGLEELGADGQRRLVPAHPAHDVGGAGGLLPPAAGSSSSGRSKRPPPGGTQS